MAVIMCYSHISLRLLIVLVISTLLFGVTSISASFAIVSSKIVDIDARNTVSVAVTDNGSVFAWGNTGEGTIMSSRPVLLNITNVTSASTGAFHILFLKDDGTVWTMGDNEYGALGTGNNETNPNIVQVNGLSNITAISSGGIHNMALKNDGTVWVWGSNLYGQLGTGTTSWGEFTPIQVKGLSGVKVISGGYMGSVAVTDDAIWTWGLNEYGQLGDSTNETRLAPTRILLNNITNVDAGKFGHAIALKSDGTVWTWGDNSYGQLGDENSSLISGVLSISIVRDRYKPGKVSGLSNVSAVTTGCFNSIAVKKDGTVWIWGENQAGRFGNGLSFGADSSKPVIVPGLANITAIAAGYSHILALSDDGTVWVWGNNRNGEIGNGGTSKVFTRPVIVISGESTVNHSYIDQVTELENLENTTTQSIVDNNDVSTRIAGYVGILMVISIVLLVWYRTRK